MQNPTKSELKQFKRACRHLLGHGRVAQRFKWQELPGYLEVFSDSDHAGCLRTRKSISSSMAFLGAHMLRHTSTTQGVVALSSGESEFYASVKAAQIGLGLISLLTPHGRHRRDRCGIKAGRWAHPPY